MRFCHGGFIHIPINAAIARIGVWTFGRTVGVSPNVWRGIDGPRGLRDGARTEERFSIHRISVPPSFCAYVSSGCQRAPTDRPAGHSGLRSLATHRYLTAGEAERQNIDAAQQGLESTRYADRAVKRLLYLA